MDGELQTHFIEDSSCNPYSNLSELAHNYSIEEVYVDDFEIIDITAQFIIADVHGSLGVSLEWGSSEDWRNGDGHSIDESFPFDTTIKYPITSNLKTAKYEIEEYDADTSSWWEGYYDED